MADSAERRKTDVDMHSKIDAMIGMLTLHMTKEEIDISDLKAKIDNYFHDLDAHTHIFHHSKVAENIKEVEKAQHFWSKIKTSIAEKTIIFVLGGAAAYLIALLWLDFGVRVQQAGKEVPAITIQLPKPNPIVIPQPHAPQP